MDSSLKRTRGRPRAFNPSPEQTTVQALDRALSILKVLAGGEGMSLSELLARSSLQSSIRARSKKPSVH